MYGYPDRRHPGVLRLAENPRTATKAVIKRGSAAARQNVTRLVERSTEDLLRHYRRAAESLEQSILATAAPDGNVKVEALQGILDGVRREIVDLADVRDPELGRSINEAAALGVDPFRESGIAVDLAGVANEAARFVQEFVAEDGLKLSDRLWRIDSGAYRAIEDQLQLAIIRGDSASRAAQDFLSRGVTVPDDIREQLGLARADRVARVPATVFLQDGDGAYWKALRVFRTEINRAHGEAYQGAAFEHPEVIGTRFLLSPNHPRTDICDMHARVNRYGLGPGVYPKGRNPWPAHPNTLSFVEVVFEDEVSDEDRKRKEDRLAWLKGQKSGVREGVLGGKHKRAAFEKGYIREKDIATPWNVLERRLRRRGIDIGDLIPEGDEQSA